MLASAKDICIKEVTLCISQLCLHMSNCWRCNLLAFEHLPVRPSSHCRDSRYLRLARHNIFTLFVFRHSPRFRVRKGFVDLHAEWQLVREMEKAARSFSGDQRAASDDDVGALRRDDTMPITYEAAIERYDSIIDYCCTSVRCF